MPTRSSRSSSKWSVRRLFGLDAPALVVLLLFLVIVIRPILFRTPDVEAPPEASVTSDRKNDGDKKPARVMGAVVWCCKTPGQVCEEVDEAECDGGFSNNRDQCSAVCRRAQR